MNILDYIILGLIAFFVLKGIFRGFFREIASLAGIIFGIWIGNHYYPQLANILKTYIPFEKFLSLISFFLLFVVVVILFNLFGILLHHFFKKLLVAWLDRGLGFGLALIKGIIISYLLIVLLIFFIPSKSPLIARSTTARMVIVTYQSMSRHISPNLYKTWKKKIFKESKKVGKALSEGKEVVKKIPQVLPDTKE
ncbi:MAG: CvpA family protein [Deltaproteobacteria bacterium]|jgi:membrane protein required for colicin V production|nr:CvpA family protein [Deltaproteobacteria bacterium]